MWSELHEKRRMSTNIGYLSFFFLTLKSKGKPIKNEMMKLIVTKTMMMMTKRRSYKDDDGIYSNLT